MTEEPYELLKERLSDRVRELLTAKGWTQVELAKRAELPQSHLSAILNNGANLTILTISKLEQAFGTPLIRVTGNRNAKKPED